jgi:hypothetical protein
MEFGFHHQCTFTWVGLDLLEDLITEAIIQEMVGMEISTSTKRGEAPARKTGPSRIPNWTIWFLRRVQKLMDNNAMSAYRS